MPVAEILPFPAPAHPRLARAIAQLDHALATQARAVRDFRGAVGELRREVARLDQGVGDYRAALEDAAVSVMETRATLRRLDATADGLLAACR
jgi:phage shock protein A